MVRVVQRSAFPPGRYRVNGSLVPFTRETLEKYAEGTNRALEAGIEVPALVRHAPPGADDDETHQFAATDGAGWLRKVEVESDGSLAWHFDVPERIKQRIDEGTLKLTSPEFRPHYRSTREGVEYSGPMIRHVAFTPTPRNPTQGAFETLAMSEDAGLVIQCSADDYEGPIAMAEENDEKKPDEGSQVDDVQSDATPVENQDSSSTEDKNPDAPPKATDETKTAAFVQAMAQLGVILPSTFDFSDESHAIDLLITAVNTKIAAEQAAEADKSEEKSDEPELSESENDGMAFSEAELRAMSPEARKKAEKINLQFAERARELKEQKRNAAREESIRAVRQANLPPAVKKKLLEGLEAVQFSENGEPATLTYSQVAKIVAEAMPPAWMQFTEGETKEVSHGEGEQFFDGGEETPESAEERAKRIFRRNKLATT